MSRPRGIESVAGQVLVAVVAVGVMLLCLYGEVATPVAVTFGALTLLVLVAVTWLVSWVPATLVVVASVAVSLISALLGGTDPLTARIEIAANVAVFVLVTVGVRATLAAAAREEVRAAELSTAARRLDETNAVLRRFTADAAHELRAPLTVLQSALEAAVAVIGRGPGRAQLEAAMGEVSRITRVVEGLLLLARSDSGELVVEAARFDLADLLEEAAGRWSVVAASNGSRVERDIPDTATARGDPRLLAHVLDNLIDNALGYSPPGVEVTVAANRTPSAWRVSVSDNGPGIPESRRAEVFDRFARVPARERLDGRRGSGLGLAICQRIATQHGAAIRLGETAGGGTTAVFELPLVDS
jgi:signal transduction histidine kinase